MQLFGNLSHSPGKEVHIWNTQSNGVDYFVYGK